jgi:hypothetical protein
MIVNNKIRSIPANQPPNFQSKKAMDSFSNKTPTYVIKQGLGERQCVVGNYFSKIIFLVSTKSPACSL